MLFTTEKLLQTTFWITNDLFNYKKLLSITIFLLMFWIDFFLIVYQFFKFINGMNKVLNELKFLFCACVLSIVS